MSDFNVSTAVATTQSFSNGIGLVTETGSITTGDTLAIFAGGSTTLNVNGAVNSGGNAVLLVGETQFEIGATGAITSISGEAISGNVNNGSKITNRGNISTLDTLGINLSLSPLSGSTALVEFTLENIGKIDLGGTIKLTSPFSASTPAKITVNNSGIILTETAMEFSSSSNANAEKAFVVTNTSTMSGIKYAQRIADGANISIINGLDAIINGNITSTYAAPSVSPSLRGDLVGNRGAINGSVSFGDQADHYDGAGGLISGDVRGGGGNDLLEAGRDNNKLFGEVGDDILRGNGGDDLLDGGVGNDTLDGGIGTDIAQFTGVRADYTFTATDAGATAQSAGFGTDTLLNIENVVFKSDAGSETFTLAQLLVISENTVDNVVGQTQHLTGTTSNDIFVIDANAADYAWGTTLDGSGIVVWKGADFDVLNDYEAIRFNDQTISLVNDTVNEYLDVAGQTQHLTGTNATDRFVIDGNRADYTVAATLDNSGIVVWQGDDFDILNDFEEIKFNDVTITLDEFGTAA